jgi:hypothetical protein
VRGGEPVPSRRVRIAIPLLAHARRAGGLRWTLCIALLLGLLTARVQVVHILLLLLEVFWFILVFLVYLCLLLLLILLLDVD